jgi:hypothetical protein
MAISGGAAFGGQEEGMKISVNVCFALLLAGLAIGSRASAATLTTLYSFCGLNACADGQTPLGPPVRDAAGNIFGTTNNGGNLYGSDAGIIYQLSQKHGNWTLKTIYQFCSLANCADGAFAQSGLIIDTQGNLYGTTSSGMSFGQGVAYELMPNARKTKWKLKVLYTFCTKSECIDGKTPYRELTYQGEAAGAPYDGASPLYGVTLSGGNASDGVLYELVRVNGRWKEKVLHSFCSLASCADGAYPSATPAVDASGNVYGATNYGNGSIYEVSMNAKGRWKESVIYRFCGQTNCSDGSFPSSLDVDGQGNLIGTAGGGGSGASCPSNFDGGCGVVFKIVPNGTQSAESVLYSFCQLADCADGASPQSINLDSGGAIIGTTFYGGGNDIDHNGYGGGTIFELNGGVETVLHAFCSLSDCTDGEYPIAHPIFDGAGNLFGVTPDGGANAIPAGGWGTAFELTR